jgi:hypothetical protein
MKLSLFVRSLTVCMLMTLFTVGLLAQSASVAQTLSVIVDNNSAGRSISGPWPIATDGQKYAEDYRFNKDGNGKDEFRWTPNLPEAGDYYVYVWYPARSDRPSDAPYVVNNGSTSVTFKIDQRTNGGKWVQLGTGTHRFQAGTKGLVSLRNTTAKGLFLAADAVMFSKTTQSTTDSTTSDSTSTTTTETTSTTGHYVATNGSSSGDGTLSKPWDLATALKHPSKVKPGDTIWVRGGTYKGNFESRLTGTIDAPIRVRAYPGERPTLDGNTGLNLGRTLRVYGGYAWFWGLEIMNSHPTRVTKQSGSAPTDIYRGTGINVYSDGIRIINCIIHDVANGIDTQPQNNRTEVHGCVVYNNGWIGPDRGHGHGIYLQNDNSPGKVVVNNVFANNFSHGIHAYGAASRLDYLTIRQNHSFHNGVWGPTLQRNFLLGGDTYVARHGVVTDNYTWYPMPAQNGQNVLGFNAGASNITMTGNIFIGYEAMLLLKVSSSTIQGNTLYGKTYGFGPYPNNTFLSSKPTGTWVRIVPNAYEPGRAHISIYNWSKASSVAVNLSSVLAVGKAYEIRNSQNYYATPVLSGTYQGGSVNIPMTGLSAVKPIGLSTNKSPYNPEFNTFVLLPR